MPTLLNESGFKFFFFSHEPEYKAPHIHVKYQSSFAIFWLDPVSLLEGENFKRNELAKARKIVIKHKTFFLEKYHEFFARKN